MDSFFGNQNISSLKSLMQQLQKKILLQNYQLWTKKQTDGAKVFKINCARSHSFLLIDMIGNDRGFISVNEEGNE